MPSPAQHFLSMAQSMPKTGAEVVALLNTTLGYWWGVYSCSLLMSSTSKPEGTACQNTEIIEVSTSETK